LTLPLLSLEESVRREGRLTVLRAPTSYRRRPADLVGLDLAGERIRSLYRENPPREIPPEGVAELRGVTIYGPGILERDDHVIRESVELPEHYEPRSREPAHRTLRAGVHVAKLGNANYGHFLLEQLPRLALNAAALPTDAPILVHERSRRFAPAILELAGVDPRRIEWIDDRPVKVEKLYWPTRTRSLRCICRRIPWAT